MVGDFVVFMTIELALGELCFVQNKWCSKLMTSGAVAVAVLKTFQKQTMEHQTTEHRRKKEKDMSLDTRKLETSLSGSTE